MGEKIVAEDLIFEVTGLCKTKLCPSFPLDNDSLLGILITCSADESIV